MTPAPRIVFVGAALAALALPAHGVAPATPPGPTAKLPVTAYQLDNGLRVVLAPDEAAPNVVVFQWFDVGSKDEEPGRTGFAHLFEHLMFEGSTHVPEGQFDLLLEAGGGYSNGTTDEDRTTYYEVVPANYLELALYLDADRLAGLWDAMNRKVLDAQRDVVKNELRQNTLNVPYASVDLAIAPALWGATHGNGHDAIGSMDDLTAASLADVEAFWRRYYVPSGATLLLVGKIDVEEARRLVDRYFAWMPTATAPATAQLATAVAPRAGTVRLSEPDRVSVPKLIEIWRGPAHFAEGDVALSVVAQILAGGKSSRLYRRLVFEDRLASEVDADWTPHVLGGRFTVDALALPGIGADAVEQALDEELARLRTAPPTAGEVLRARRVLEAELLRGMESLVWRAERLAEYDAYLGTPDHLEAELAELAAITPEAIQQAVDAWLGVDARVIATVVPAPVENAKGAAK